MMGSWRSFAIALVSALCWPSLAHGDQDEARLVVELRHGQVVVGEQSTDYWGLGGSLAYGVRDWLDFELQLGVERGERVWSNDRSRQMRWIRGEFGPRFRHGVAWAWSLYTALGLAAESARTWRGGWMQDSRPEPRFFLSLSVALDARPGKSFIYSYALSARAGPGYVVGEFVFRFGGHWYPLLDDKQKRRRHMKRYYLALPFLIACYTGTPPSTYEEQYIVEYQCPNQNCPRLLEIKPYNLAGLEGEAFVLYSMDPGIPHRSATAAYVANYREVRGLVLLHQEIAPWKLYRTEDGINGQFEMINDDDTIALFLLSGYRVE